LECADFHGNTAVVTVPLVAAIPDLPVVPEITGSGGRGTVSLDCKATWLTLTVSFTAPETEPPRLIFHGASAESDTFLRVDEKTFRAGIVPRQGADRLDFRVEHPRIDPFERQIAVYRPGVSSSPITFEEIELRPAPDSAYGTLYAAVTASSEEATSDGIITRSRAYQVWPATAAIAEAVTISLPVPEVHERSERLDIYRRSGSRWAPLGGSIVDSRIVARTSRFGEFAVFEDATPPFLNVEVPAANSTAASARPAIYGRVEDSGSGLRGITVYCGDQWLLTEYDPEEADFEWARDVDLPSGDQTLVVQATDNAGNVATIERAIRIP
jgi:hypothetical protein